MPSIQDRAPRPGYGPARQVRNRIRYRHVPFFLCLALVGRSASATDAPISAAVASLHVGRERIVEGRVVAAERRDATVRLRLGDSPQSLVVNLVLGLLSRFPDHPEQAYLGKEVRVVGTIESFRGTPEIAVHDPDHIQILDALSPVAAPSPATAASSREAEELRRQLEQMRAQVEEMERRLKQLEPVAP